MAEKTFYAQFAGWWCDNCEIAAKHHNALRCPDCSEPPRPAQITVEPNDLDGEPGPFVIGHRRY